MESSEYISAQNVRCGTRVNPKTGSIHKLFSMTLEVGKLNFILFKLERKLDTMQGRRFNVLRCNLKKKQKADSIRGPFQCFVECTAQFPFHKLHTHRPLIH